MEENLVDNQTTTESKQRHVLVFGKHDYILKNVQDLLTKSGYSNVGFTNLLETSDYIRLNDLDAVLIGGGVDPHDRLVIRGVITETGKTCKVVEHYGGPATIVRELSEALAR